MKSMWIRAFRSSGRKTQGLALGLLLASFANEDGNGIRVTQSELAAMASLPEWLTATRMRELFDDGWIKPAMVNGEASLRLAIPRF